MITVARFSLPLDAQLARAKLESEGIPAFVADEHTINMQWLYSNALGGVRVQVPDVFAEEAIDLLRTDFSSALIEERGVDLPVCAKCGSNNLEPLTKGKKMAFIVFLFFNFPLWPFKRQVKCLDCGAISNLKS
ncbi:MAG: DUF2007 domain-containing protein [Pseudomonadota bacterium]